MFLSGLTPGGKNQKMSGCLAEIFQKVLGGYRPKPNPIIYSRMNLITHFSYKELAFAIRAISISRGLPERLELLHFLLDRGIYRKQIVEEALCHCCHFMIDHPQSNLIRIALECVKVLEQKKSAKKVLKLIDIIDAYVDWFKSHDVSCEFYRIDEDGVSFYNPESFCSYNNCS
jgi:hypothetical protein